MTQLLCCIVNSLRCVWCKERLEVCVDHQQRSVPYSAGHHDLCDECYEKQYTLNQRIKRITE